MTAKKSESTLSKKSSRKIDRKCQFGRRSPSEMILKGLEIAIPRQ
ncbi:MAG: hypothetical protein AAGA60_13090 [Cyanobacteria bacterium P01_E01_bin.42]